jgi:ATPase subunit of ABC transporter with duplicated ATPase domains
MLPTQLLVFRTKSVVHAFVVPALCKLRKGRGTLGPVSASNQKPGPPAILERFGHVQEEYEHLNGYAIESQAREVLHGLGFKDDQIDGDVGALSGGWKMRVASLYMGYFAQQSLDVLNPDLTVAEQLQQDFPQDSIGALRNLAGAFQFSGDDVDKKIRALSGGEKSRLAIARMLYNPPNFLVLDEPTNHLDLATKEMLVDALKDFEGTMIFVSHDRMFLRGLGSRVLELGGESGTGRNPTVYPGSYVEYVQKLGHEAPGIYA